ncbi:hypothetical protein SCA6_000511 [Theobroma cacao]
MLAIYLPALFGHIEQQKKEFSFLSFLSSYQDSLCPYSCHVLCNCADHFKDDVALELRTIGYFEFFRVGVPGSAAAEN